MISIKKVITIFLISAAFLFSAENPVSVIKKKDVELQSLLKKSSLSKNEKERIKTLLNDSKIENFELENIRYKLSNVISTFNLISKELLIFSSSKK